MTNPTNLVRGEEMIPTSNPAGLNLRDRIALGIYGITASDAISQNVCVACKASAMTFRDQLSGREYLISGLCQTCQDAVFTN